MKVAKNMDTVFADCTDDELEFELLFGDSEDTLIDLVAGVNESGEFVTEDFDGLSEAEILKLEEAEELVADDKAVCEKCGKAPCECATAKKEAAELDGAAEDNAGAATDLDGVGEPKPGVGCADNKGVAPGLAGAADGNDTSEDPITDEVQANQEAKDVSEDEDVAVDESYLSSLLEELESIEDPDDKEARDGKAERDTDNVEGVSTETPAKAMDSASTEKDPIEDCCDTGEREGECKHDESDKEGVDQPVIGAAADTNANGDVEDASVDEDAMLEALIAAIDEEEDMLTDKDDADQREGKVKTTNDVEGAEEVKPEIGGEVGDGKEVSGKENSAESHAHDLTKDIEDAIGVNDKQQVKLEDAAEGPLEDDDLAEREGKVSDEADEDPALADDAYSEAVDALLAALDEEDDILTDIDDAEQRDGKAEPVKDVEGVKQDVVGTAIDGGNNIDVTVDIDDAEQRDGKTNPNDGMEGVDQTAVGAALENADEFLDDILAALDGDEDLKGVELVVPDDVKTNGTSSVEESADTAAELAEDLDDEDIEAVADDKEDTTNKDYSYDVDDDDDELIDAVINGIDLE